ncbi:alpha/beta hydrolase [Actinomadura fulvescens]|uniref:Alpha/beta hydrolase family protein n=1 Tax=Actinomadura fulvescens TaxID=46160 RepID=A0ABN3PHI6_9ACTN
MGRRSTRQESSARRILLVALAILTASTLTSGASTPEPYAAPVAAVAESLSPPALERRYQAVREDIGAALTTARRLGDDQRVRVLSAFLGSGRRFLTFDGRGDGKAVEVHGDLARAGRIAVVVPGADGELDNYDSWKFAGGGAKALYGEMRRTAPGERVAVVAWLGYDSPSVLSPVILTDGRAGDAARGLRRFLAELREVNPAARYSLLAHSYGSVVVGKAAAKDELAVDEIAVFGSPGTSVDSAADLRTRARVWAGRSAGDWTEYVPNVEFAGVGFGTDPTDARFGALRFDAGSGSHSEYLKPGSPSLRTLALIALGHDPEAGHARHQDA